jgi:LysM repeat protein
MSEVSAEQYEVEEQSTQVHTHDVVVVERDLEEDTRGELLKFGILVIVLLFTVLIVALLRPYIFNTIVPAVLGEGQPTAPVMDDTNAETIKPAAEEAEESEAVEEGESEAVDTEEEEASDTAVSPTDSSEAVTEPENPEDFPTAVPAQSHTVQAGENLTAIAQRYGTTVQAIVTANNLTNPDRVAVGTVLIIPESSNQ